MGLFFYFIADILTSLTEMFLEWSSNKHLDFVHVAELDWLPWKTSKQKKRRKNKNLYKKNNFLRTHKDDEANT